MAVQEKHYTADELWELTQQPVYAHKHLELWEGSLIEMAPSSTVPGIVASRLDRWIGNFVDEHDLGYVVTAEGGFELSPKNVLAPDVGFVAKQRIKQMPERYFQGAPDLAVEVVSPTDSVKDVQRKAAKYLAAGTRIVWLFYPVDKTVDVCHAAPDGGMNIQEVSSDGTLDGEDVLPGFSLKVADVFKGLEHS